MVILGHNNKRKISELGVFECKEFTLKDVFYIKNLKRNLISINQLYDAGFKVLLDRDGGIILDSENKVMTTASTKSNVFLLLK